jgi:hypothetical protein
MADLVIAIDDAGDFKTGSELYHFYVGAMVRAGKEEQFRRWEDGLPAQCRKDGEVKGGYLSADRQHDFVREVICSEPRVIITRITIQPSIHEPGAIASQQTETVRLLRLDAESFETHGLRDKAAEALGMARWIAHSKEPHYVKLWVQTQCIAQSFADAVGHSYVGGFDGELASLRYKIDPGLLGDDDPSRLTYWRRFLAMQLRRFRTEERGGFPAVWQETGHPFMDLYYRGENRWDFRALFEERCDFPSSKDSFEIRIADIVGSIHRQFWMGLDKRMRRYTPYARMRRCGAFAGRGKLTKLLFEHALAQRDQGSSP